MNDGLSMYPVLGPFLRRPIMDIVNVIYGYSLAIAVKDAKGTLNAYTKPLGSYVSRTSPLSCLPRVSISRVPKLRLSGARTAGPFFSLHSAADAASWDRPSRRYRRGRQAATMRRIW